MRVIPVLDLLAGTAVHARRGERSRYRPVQSCLAPGTADPLRLAGAYRAAGYRELYVADLDAIAGTGSHLGVVTAIAAATGLRVLLDAGLRRAADAPPLLAAGAAAVIAGSETLQDWRELAALVRAVGAERVIFSLDLRAGQVVSAGGWLQGAGPAQVLAEAARCGVRTAVLLELQAVGSEAGPPLALAAGLRQAVPDVELLVGGGVRDAEDLDRLAAVGAAGALVATALHTGRLRRPVPEGVSR